MARSAYPGRPSLYNPEAAAVAAAVRWSLVLLAGLSAAGVLIISARHELGGDASGALVTFVLMGTPMAMFLALGLLRSGYVVASSVFAIATAALGAIVAAFLEPALATQASIYLMVAAIMLVGSHVMPFRFAASLAAFNLVTAIALPSFAPTAGSAALQIPYVFLFSNAILLLFSSVLRNGDQARMHRLEDEASLLEVRYDLLRAAADHMQMEHEQHVRTLQEKAVSQRHVLDAASHELRTPITPLLVQVAAFRRRYEPRLDADQRQGLELLERNLRRMALLVGDLLDIGRLEGGRLVLRPQPLGVRGLLEQTRETFLSQAEEAHVELVVDSADLNLQADATRISQVLYNLVSNAIKFSPEGGTVRLSARPNNGGVEILVEDEGLGIEPQRQRELFQPFGRVHGDGIKGTGLGLYICRGIIAQHGGQVWVRSEGAGKGATFGLWLPSQPPAVGAATIVAPAPATEARPLPN